MSQRNTLIASSLVVMAAIGAYFTMSSEQPAPRIETAAAPVAAPQRPLEMPRLMPPSRVASVPETHELRTRPLRRKAAAPAAANGLTASAFADGRPQHPEASAAPYRVENAKVSPAKIARREKNFTNPMDSRWVPSLSGRGARIDMGKKSVATGKCSETRDCERKPAPEQAWVAGVVVTTERIEAAPSAPLVGQLANGHYLDDTPGVYVQ